MLKIYILFSLLLISYEINAFGLGHTVLRHRALHHAERKAAHAIPEGAIAGSIIHNRHNHGSSESNWKSSSESNENASSESGGIVANVVNAAGEAVQNAADHVNQHRNQHGKLHWNQHWNQHEYQHGNQQRNSASQESNGPLTILHEYSRNAVGSLGKPFENAADSLLGRQNENSASSSENARSHSIGGHAMQAVDALSNAAHSATGYLLGGRHKNSASWGNRQTQYPVYFMTEEQLSRFFNPQRRYANDASSLKQSNENSSSSSSESGPNTAGPYGGSHSNTASSSSESNEHQVSGVGEYASSMATSAQNAAAPRQPRSQGNSASSSSESHENAGSPVRENITYQRGAMSQGAQNAAGSHGQGQGGNSASSSSASKEDTVPKPGVIVRHPVNARSLGSLGKSIGDAANSVVGGAIGAVKDAAGAIGGTIGKVTGDIGEKLGDATQEITGYSSIYEEILDKVQCDCNRPSDLDVLKTELYFTDWETGRTEMKFVGQAKHFLHRRLDTSRCLHVFFLGFNSKYELTLPLIKASYRNVTCNGRRPYSVIVDSQAYTNILPEPVLAYKRSVKYAKSIAYATAKKFIVPAIKKFGNDNVSIIGHSLGGQMTGYAGTVVEQQLGYKAKSIFAIDPAGPCYEECPDEHVSSGAAEIVNAFHCDAGRFGSNLNLADFDFYSHDGTNQYECGAEANDIAVALAKSGCSHVICVPISFEPANRANENIWSATQCDSYSEMQTGQCDRNEVAQGGVGVTPNARNGKYYFETDKTFMDNLRKALSLSSIL